MDCYAREWKIVGGRPAPPMDGFQPTPTMRFERLESVSIRLKNGRFQPI